MLAVMRALPASITTRVYFLGGQRSYPGNLFEEHGGDWYRQNAGRGRVLAPTLEAVAQESAMAVVLATGPVLDAEDWRDDESRVRTLFVRMSDFSPTGGTALETAPDPSEICRHIENPVIRVEMIGDGVIPFYWTNSAYRWNERNIVCEDVSRFGVRVGLLCVEGASVGFRAFHRDGDRRDLASEICSPVSPDPWRVLNRDDACRVRACVRDGCFRCPHCGRTHSASSFYCRPERVVRPLHDRPRPVYSFAESADFPANGYLLFSSNDQVVKYRPHPCAALLVDEQVVAIRSGAQASLYAYCARERSWKCSGRVLDAYQRVIGGVHAAIP